MRSYTYAPERVRRRPKYPARGPCPRCRASSATLVWSKCDGSTSTLTSTTRHLFHLVIVAIGGREKELDNAVVNGNGEGIRWGELGLAFGWPPTSCFFEFFFQLLTTKSWFRLPRSSFSACFYKNRFGKNRPKSTLTHNRSSRYDNRNPSLFRSWTI
jgi:hypothetical protein